MKPALPKNTHNMKIMKVILPGAITSPNQHLDNNFDLYVISHFEKEIKKKERNFIYVSSRSSAGALIGDTVN